MLADNLLAIQVMNLHHTSLTLSNHSRHAWLKYSQTARIKGKGRGVLASRALRRGELVCEYHGDLINAEEGFAREAVYAVSWIFLFLSAHWKLLFVIFQKDTREIPCCLFWITFRTVKYWFDAYLSRWCLTLYRYVRVRSNNFNRYDWLIHALKQSIFDLFFVSIDATFSPRMARLINHSRHGNLRPKIIPVGGVPHLFLIAKRVCFHSIY